MPSVHEQAGFTTSRAAAPQTAAVVQGPDAVEPFQTGGFFPRTHLEGAAHAAHRETSAAGLSQAETRRGRDHLDRPRVVSHPVHGPERAGGPEFRELAFFVEADKTRRAEDQRPAANRPGFAVARALRSFSQADVAPAAASQDRRDAVGRGGSGA